MAQVSSLQDDLIGELRKGGEAKLKALEQIYRKVKASCISTLIKKFSCSEEEATEIFQQAILIVYKGDLKGIKDNSSKALNNYIIGICKNIFLGKVRNEQKNRHIDIEKAELAEELAVRTEKEESGIKNIEQKFDHHARRLSWKFIFDKVGERCKQLIHFRVEGLSILEMADKLGKSESRIKSNMAECKKNLKALLRKYPHHRDLLV
ncbi:MAG: sigma-70 family RNA polymerase sigma factor [Bacteroidota bacterium]